MTFLEAAVAILREHKKPLHFREITERAVRGRLLEHVGRTPEQTMQARLAEEVKKGRKSLLIRVRPGVFRLRKNPIPEDVLGTPEEALLAAEIAEELGEHDSAAEAGTPVPKRRVSRAADWDDTEEPDEDRTLEVVEKDPEALLEEYADELDAGPVLSVEEEPVDEDADREMGKVMTARSRRGRRSRKQNDERKGRRGEDRKSKARPPREERPAKAAPAVTGPTRTLADIAWEMLVTLKDPRPVHARQLTEMARKRRLVEGGGEDLWKSVKAALLDDVRARQARGLRQRVRHQGGGTFVLAAAGLDEGVARREEALARAAAELHEETQRAVQRRLARLPGGAFERLCRVYLSRVGARDLKERKRTRTTVYLSGELHRGAARRRILVAVRPGGGTVSRRQVEELRAEVKAHEQDEGVLLCAATLDDAGLASVGRGDLVVSSYDGPHLATALALAGVGVIPVHLPVAYLDLDFFASLQED